MNIGDKVTKEESDSKFRDLDIQAVISGMEQRQSFSLLNVVELQ